MDLVKKNIHMDRIRVSTVTQLSLEEDMNLQESKPDCSRICFTRGWVETEDVKPLMDEVRIGGKLMFCMLYHTEEGGSGLVRLEGKIPFEEKVHMQGVMPSDIIQVEGVAEDLTISMINSRKLNVRAVITLSVHVEELYDEEIVVGIHAKEPLEYRKSNLDTSQILISKKDIFRWKDEISLPANYPNIFKILWNDLTVKDLEFKLMNGRIGLQGEAAAFVMYEAEGEGHDILFFEKNVPFSGMIECQGCGEALIPDIRYMISQKEFSIRPDGDGEERGIGLEMILDLNLKLYEEETIDIVTDIYGVDCEVNSHSREAVLQRALCRVSGKMKLTEKIRVRGKSGGILQMVHSEGTVSVEETKVAPGGLWIAGILCVKILFITGDDVMPYSSAEEQLPFRYTLEIPNLEETDICNLQAKVEMLQIQLLDSEEMEVRAGLGFQTTAFRPMPVEAVENAETSKLDSENWRNIPGIVIYVVKPGDSLWKIGKKYYIPAEQIKALNNLENDKLQVGQKLFLVKGGIV